MGVITMGKRDFGRKEQKKPRKDARKTLETSILPPPPPVEVEIIRKKRKEPEEEE